MSTDAPSSAAPSPDPTLDRDTDHITTSTRDPKEMADALQQWLAGTLEPGSNPVISDVTSPESNGMSSETLLFTAAWTEGGQSVERRLVARIEPQATAYPVFTTYDLDMQYRVMRLVGEHTSVPVPETLWYEPDPSVLGGSFFVMAGVDGLVPPDVMPYTFGDNWVFDTTAANRRKLQESAISAMAGIHAITPADHDLKFLELDEPGATSLERSFHHWQQYHDWVVKDTPSPLLSECFSWLMENFPTQQSADAVSWGDGRIGNMMFRDYEVVAVLDWEMAAVAPPEVDLGWMCYLHLFFQDLAVQLGAPGLPDMFRPTDLVESYARASGRAPGDLKWYIAYAAMRHGVIMRRVTERAIFFGEAEKPEDIDDLIIHRDTLRAMVADTYWSGIGL